MFELKIKEVNFWFILWNNWEIFIEIKFETPLISDGHITLGSIKSLQFQIFIYNSSFDFDLHKILDNEFPYIHIINIEYFVTELNEYLTICICIYTKKNGLDLIVYFQFIN